METFSPSQPVVKLINYFNKPYDNAIATARTCYSSRVIYTDEVSKDEKAKRLRDSIAASTYEAGHHTTLQHATFQFVLEKVSRQFIWSFLHSHPFYNSEQVSQRYVAVKPGSYYIPELDQTAQAVYVETANLQMDAYHQLNELLWEDASNAFFKLFPARRAKADEYQNQIKKKVQEISRYILPVATYAHLYHTVSGLTLHRYHKLQRAFDTPLEQQQVIDGMIQAVLEKDPEFMKQANDPIPLDQTPEYGLFRTFQETGWNTSSEFVDEFDRTLDGGCSKLIDYKVNAEKSMAQSIRDIFGVTESQLSDGEALDRVMNPSKNPYLAERLNLNAHTKLSRTMVHPHFTFRKKLSHTADSQDQRHRMTPGTRPVLQRQFVASRPDYITPPLIANNAKANAFYQETMNTIWNNVTKLLNHGVSVDLAMYLLPNAFPIRFEESGDLLNFHHKWTSRLCYTAQEEIWKASLEEVLQVKEVHPVLADYLLPPCGLRSVANRQPYCPEGNRFCGVPVWRTKREEYVRTL